jgi:hypothetical protein
MSTKYHNLEYFIFKYVLIEWYKNTIKYYGIQIFYSQTALYFLNLLLLRKSL